jgi:hypothetical protein
MELAHCVLILSEQIPQAWFWFRKRGFGSEVRMMNKAAVLGADFRTGTR